MENKSLNDLEIYEYVMDDNLLGVFGYGIVTTPANGVNCFYFNEEEVENKMITKMADEDKRLLTSAMLVPNIKIYRKDVNGEGPAYVYFTEDLIEKLQQNFAKNNNGSNATLNHISKLDGVYVVESWIVSNPEMDKSKFLGFSSEDTPKGTWMTTIKVDNDEIWQNYIKTGILKGLSIEGELMTKKINKTIMNRRQLNSVIRMSIQKVAMEAGLVEFETKDGVKVYSNELILENVITDVDGNPLLDGEFEIDGKIYKTDDQGVIVEIEDVKPDEEVVEVEEEVVMDEAEQAMITELEGKLSEKEAIIADLEKKITDLEAELVKSENTVVEMSLQRPASKGIKNVPSLKKEVDLKNESMVEKLNRLRK